jgi:transcriptional regulator with XRE-family HTH domain
LELNNKIIDLRNEIGKTQSQLADDLDISRSTIAMIESGERKPGYDLLMKIADYFNISLDYLLGRVEEKDSIVVKHVVEGRDIKLEVDMKEYPDGLTHEQVVEILEKLKGMGMDFRKINKED